NMHSTVQNLKISTGKMGTRLTTAEHHIADIEDREESQVAKVKQLEEAERSESRSQRNNICIVGFPEGVGKGNPSAFFSKVLPDLLHLPENLPIEIEKFHHSLGPCPTKEQHPRAFIVKLLCFPTKEKLFRAARDLGPLDWQGHKISLFPDFS
uniref:L1 transposable element RRM domain-containing protein n=1 Tax=Latimeria chalumnae TaxID=7897 RepID=H3ABZ9_LATCH